MKSREEKRGNIRAFCAGSLYAIVLMVITEVFGLVGGLALALATSLAMINWVQKQ